MINKRIDDINKSDIESLVSNEIRENRSLEYKQTLPSIDKLEGKKDEKSEFLNDISSMANAAGGDIVYGISDRQEDGKPSGIPEKIVGLHNVSFDAVSLRLENIIRDGIEPRINGLQLRFVQGFESGCVLVIRVPKSYLAPHMVKLSSRFYSRSTGGKHQLDVSEIRSAFALSEVLPEKIRRFRDERLARIVADETPVNLQRGAKVVLHVLPISSLDPMSRIDVSSVNTQHDKMPLISPSRYHHTTFFRFNLDGLVRAGGPTGRDSNLGYIQLFRNGAVEVVDSRILQGHDSETTEPVKYIESTLFEPNLIGCLRDCLRLIHSLNIGPPITVMLSLIGAKEYRISRPSSWNCSSISLFAIDRDSLLLPDAMIQDFREPSDIVLQPALDALWQCVGEESDLHYRDSPNGRWIEAPGKPPSF